MRLSIEHREVIDLVYYHEKSVDEVAHILDIPPATVKTRMFYARKKLAGTPFSFRRRASPLGCKLCLHWMDGMAQQDKITTIDLIRAILARNRAALALGISLAAVVLGTSLVLLVADHLSVTAVQADLAAERARMVRTIEAHAKE